MKSIAVIGFLHLLNVDVGGIVSEACSFHNFLGLFKGGEKALCVEYVLSYELVDHLRRMMTHFASRWMPRRSRFVSAPVS